MIQGLYRLFFINVCMSLGLGRCQLQYSLSNCPSIQNELLALNISLGNCSEDLTDCLMNEFSASNALCATCIIVSNDLQRESICECLQCLINTLATKCSKAHCAGSRTTGLVYKLSQKFDNSLPKALPLVSEPVHELQYVADSNNVIRRGIFTGERYSLINALLEALGHKVVNKEEGMWYFELDSLPNVESIKAPSDKTYTNTVTTGKVTESHTLSMHNSESVFNIVNKASSPIFTASLSIESSHKQSKPQLTSSVIDLTYAPIEVVNAATTNMVGTRYAPYVTGPTKIAPDESTRFAMRTKAYPSEATKIPFLSSSTTSSESKAFIISIAAATFATFSIFAISDISTTVDSLKQEGFEPCLEVDAIFHPASYNDESDINEFTDSEVDNEVMRTLPVPVPHSTHSFTEIADTIHKMNFT
ncbi:uncharacterized protein Ecym_6130 [Eremothecium cymbalariae DBVPG|uniref:Extracellular membrane protein CFEM domain-containing protein n=1 Tax=Eremothecium cymbalariae (strain CBS 270.75 / DBVPG 7215 / KCTC 17166 / NRRL Y-17582) TaxID=931890 RepID=G8JV43_ERECY|nr:hypothetical protein Ecym_6130 [Eremothecium cymbalariae DBVPG\